MSKPIRAALVEHVLASVKAGAVLSCCEGNDLFDLEFFFLVGTSSI